MFASADLAGKKWAKVSPLRWRSFKLERHTQSTLGSELMSLSRGMAECDWLRAMMAEAWFENYELERGKEHHEKFDNKPIYDHTQGDGIVVRDKRMAIDMLLVRRDIKSSNMVLRWVDRQQMLADCLTKTTADPGVLRFVMRFGEYIVVKEDRSLEWRLRERQKRKEAREKFGQGIKKGYVKD